MTSKPNYKLEHKILYRKIMLRLLLAFIIFGILYLWVFKVFTNINNFWGIFGGNKKTYVQKEVPIQAPYLKAQPKYYNKETIEISGYAQKDFNVILFQNGEEIEKTPVPDSGEFTFSQIKVQPGRNTFYVIQERNDGKRSEKSNEQTVTFDKDKPKLSVDKPSNNDTVEERNFTVSVEGFSEPNAKVTVNDGYAVVDSDGKYSYLYQANEGGNTLTIKAIDEAGNENEIKVSFEFKPL